LQAINTSHLIPKMTWKALCTPHALLHAEVASSTPDRKMVTVAPKGIATNKMALVTNDKPPLETSCANLITHYAIPRHRKHDGQQTAKCEREWIRSKRSIFDN
jgi:methionine-rich copper-binding protein CopC